MRLRLFDSSAEPMKLHPVAKDSDLSSQRIGLRHSMEACDELATRSYHGLHNVSSSIRQLHLAYPSAPPSKYSHKIMKFETNQLGSIGSY